MPPYRISPELSRKLRVVTLLAVVAVVWVHAYNLTSRFAVGENVADLRGAPGVAGFIEYLVSQTLCRWPAATLFAISGFLFFHNLQPRAAAFVAKYRRRLRTLVLPFVLWSALGLLLYIALQALPGSERFFTSDFLGEFSVAQLFAKLLLEPVAYPLWFLQTLIFCIAVSPLLYPPVRYLRWFAVVPLAVPWVLGVQATNWTVLKGLTFFTVGAVIALELRRGALPAPPLWLRRSLLPLWLVCCVLFTAFLRDDRGLWVSGLHKALMVLAVAAIWLGYETYLQRFEGSRAVVALLPFSFFIFAAQEPLLSMIKRTALKGLGVTDATLLAVYVLAPVLTLAIVVAAAAAMRRYLPRPYAYLTGGR